MVKILWDVRAGDFTGELEETIRSQFSRTKIFLVGENVTT